MTAPSTGAFITFEGGEGAGKSTQIKEVAKRLKTEGCAVTVTREPGGTPNAEAIRTLMLAPEHRGWDGWTEALLMLAARVEHARKVIEPALAAGNVVLCDRYIDSTFVYQGIARGLGVEAVQALHLPALRLPMPMRTIVLDAPVATTSLRLQNRRRVASRFDAEAIPFHDTIRKGFLTLAERWPQRLTVVDACLPVTEVTRQIVQIILPLIKGTPA